MHENNTKALYHEGGETLIVLFDSHTLERMLHPYIHVMDAALKCVGFSDYYLPISSTGGAQRHGALDFQVYVNEHHL